MLGFQCPLLANILRLSPPVMLSFTLSPLSFGVRGWTLLLASLIVYVSLLNCPFPLSEPRVLPRKIPPVPLFLLDAPSPPFVLSLPISVLEVVVASVASRCLRLYWKSTALVSFNSFYPSVVHCLLTMPSSYYGLSKVGAGCFLPSPGVSSNALGSP